MVNVISEMRMADIHHRLLALLGIDGRILSLKISAVEPSTKPVITKYVCFVYVFMVHSIGLVIKNTPMTVDIPNTPIYTMSMVVMALSKVSYIPITNSICDVLIPGNISASAMMIPVTNTIR